MAMRRRRKTQTGYGNFSKRIVFKRFFLISHGGTEITAEEIGFGNSLSYKKLSLKKKRN
jgi:hypothetical protein